MAEMVLVKCESGSKTATVRCVRCGRISFQILAGPYSPGTSAQLLLPHRCPVCGEVYRSCGPEETETGPVQETDRRENGDGKWQREQGAEETAKTAGTGRDTDTVNALLSVLQQVARKKAEMTEAGQLRTGEETGEPDPEQTGTRTAEAEGSRTAGREMRVTPEEDLEEKISRWKQELLDTGKRNRMINFRETRRSTLRILEPEAKELFNRLAFSGKPLTFMKPISRSSDLRTYSIIALMETLSYPMDVQVGDIRTAGTILEREKTLRNLRAKAKLAQEEQGANILYLCFGFIGWREQQRESAPWLWAPLLMMPVTLGLKALNAPFTLSRDDDEIVVNPTLSHLFSTEYQIDLPPFELKNRQSLEAYFAEIEEIVDRRGWRLSKDVSLGLLSFQKISMYHDLEDNHERMLQHPVLRAMAGDRQAIPELPAQAEHFDFDALKPDEWHEVVDADSSQEEAILLSKLGVSFVMQGPPGTGKSQTITNIIAEALADGRKVLFVSEKAAALQVVLRRLTEAGLADFCLSLHNYKANRKEIIDSIGANLRLEEEYADDSDLVELTELFHDRKFLNEYAGELHRQMEPLGRSLYEIFGKMLALEGATALKFRLERPEEVTKEQYAAMQYSVSALEKALQNMDGRLSRNPWYGASTRNDRTRILQETGGLSDLLRRIEALAGDSAAQIGVNRAECFSDLHRLVELSDIFRGGPAWMSPGWFTEGTAGTGQEALAEAYQHAGRLQKFRETIQAGWDLSALSFEPESVRAAYSGDFGWIYEGEGPAEQRLAAQREAAEKLKQRLEEILSAGHEGLELIAFQQTDTLEHLRMLSRVLRRIAEASVLKAGWFDARRNAASLALIDQAIAHSAAICTLKEEILRDWEPTALEIDADGMLGRFKTEYVGLFRIFKPGYKEDMRTLRLHARTVGQKIDQTAAIAFLQKVRELKRENAWFEENAEALAALTDERGAAADWKQVRSSMTAALEIAGEFPYSGIPDATAAALVRITESPERLGRVRRLAEQLSEEALARLEAEIRGCRGLGEMTDRSNLSQDVLPGITVYLEQCAVQERAAAELAAARKGSVLRYEDIMELLSSAATVREEEAWFAAQQEALNGLFSEAYKAEESDWNDIYLGLVTAQRLSEAFVGKVPEKLIQMLCEGGDSRAAFEQRTAELADLMRRAEPKLQAFGDLFQADFTSRPLNDVADHAEACLNGFGELGKWLDVVDARRECDVLGLSEFTAAVMERDNTVPDILAAFERGFCIQWLNQNVHACPAVRDFRRRVHEQRAERFVRLDAGQVKFARKRIRERIIRTYPDADQPASASSELGTLRHEMEKKRRIMPLRRLFQRIPKLLLTLKPCLMMSPLSVAYFLDAEKYQFDLVIFDEASQIFPQDAVGAIFRARQVIIAGDTKQLPPTNFFAASTGSGKEGYDDAEGYEEEMYDSILEETAAILPNRTLRWHYRSRNERLIAFSNQEIYNRDLITFPGCNESEPDTGVEFVYVEEGCYEPYPRACNVPEARRVVELVREHIERHPDRSLGVIAFSEKQQQVIAMEIQRFRESNPRYEAFFAEGREEEFFVKNLENVQGDERDTIFFSIGYARTREQKAENRPMAMRFGPLSIAGGERRLNVAITRAKINIKLVSSILPSDIDLSRTESAGVRLLRSYIEFARNREVLPAKAYRGGRPDEFADTVARFVRAQGFDVQQNVGCSGYRIDIAVRHPSPDIRQFIAGIECDGYSYASARTARDRDRLRGTVLRNMGWNLYRVWSPEWIRNPETEEKKLAEFLRESVRICDEKIRMLEEQRKKDEAAGLPVPDPADNAEEAEVRQKTARTKTGRKRREEAEKADAGRMTEPAAENPVEADRMPET